MNERVKKCKYAKYSGNSLFCEKRNELYDCAKEDVCGNCLNYRSKYIEFPITVDNITHKKISVSKSSGYDIGELVVVRPMCENRAYLGILLGDLPNKINVSYNSDTKELSVGAGLNPAIYIPEKKEIVFSCDSWWRVIDDINQYKKITNKEIKEDTWFMKLLRDKKQLTDFNYY